MPSEDGLLGCDTIVEEHVASIFRIVYIHTGLKE
jgi:hypothetical protein